MAIDWDDLLGYSTTRMVKIRDRRLGIMYYSFLVLIFVYIVGYVVLKGQGYKQPSSIVGTIRMSVERPQAPFRKNVSQLEYCGTGNYTSSEGDNLPRLPCRFLDQFDAVFPAVQTRGISITTRMTQTEERLSPNCDHFRNLNCNYEHLGSDSYYVGDLGFFTLLMDHTLTAPEANIERTSTDMPGTLVDQDGNALDPCDDYTNAGFECPPYINVQSRGPDIVPLNSLFRAAGITGLDELLGPSRPGESLRYAGTVLLVQIFYSNYISFNPENVQYTYRVSLVENTEYKVTQVIPRRGAELSNRTLLDRHGLRVAVEQEGQVGRFNFQVLLVQLVSSLGLLAVAKLAVDTILQYVLPLRFIYRQYKTITSFDFSDLTEEDLELFKASDRINPLPRLPSDMEGARDSRSVWRGDESRSTRTLSGPRTRLLDSTDTPRAGYGFSEYD